MTEIVRRLSTATLLLLLTVAAGTGIYHHLGNGRWGWFECLYHTVITVSTVGFSEMPGIERVPHARAFTISLIVLGTGSAVYFASNVTAVIVEGDIRSLLRRNRMRKGIESLRDHVIVCGVGRTGAHVVDELRATRTPFVAVDADSEKLASLAEERPDLAYVVGDATEDETLRAAGIARARGVVAALTDDKANLYVTLSARSLNPALRIIAKGVEASAEPKLLKAGADKVVSPNMIGGLRLASEMIRPEVTSFLDIMLRDPEHVLRIEEAVVTAGSGVAGRSLGAAGLRRISDVLVVAVRTPAGRYTFNPGAEQLLEPGITLLVLGEQGEIEKLRAALK